MKHNHCKLLMNINSATIDYNDPARPRLMVLWKGIPWRFGNKMYTIPLEKLTRYLPNTIKLQKT